MDARIVAAIVVAGLIGGALAAPPRSSAIEPVVPGEGEDESSNKTSNAGGGNGEEGTVPSLPVEWQQALSCDLRFGGLSFGGLQEACQKHHHHFQENARQRCCPVLASWLYAAQVETALEAISASSSSSAAPSSSAPQVEMPVPPDDSSVCAAGLQQGLHSHGIDLPMVNESCDMSLCFCGIRLQQTAALSCPLGYFHRNRSAASVSQAPFLRRLETDCSDSKQHGCSSCILALDNAMAWIGEKTATAGRKKASSSMTADCRLMGLMWLLSTNRTRFIPTVSAVIRALRYSSPSNPDHHQQMCSPDDSGLPLAIDTGRLLGPEDLSSGSSIPSVELWSSIVFPLVLLLQRWWDHL